MTEHAPEAKGTEAEETGVEETSERPTWSRAVIFGAALLAVLLFGATLGMFLTRTLDGGSAPATPDAGSVEVGFAQDMSVHHLQAVTMANWEWTHTTDPELKQLAFDMASTQLEQVGRMHGWLMLWGRPEEATGPYMAWMTGPMGHDGMGGSMTSVPTKPGAPMPGMATDAELSRLRSLSGEALDVYFLQLMLRHHQGGTAMAQYALDHSNVDAVKQLAQSMLASQGAEMTQMQQLLAVRGAKPLTS